jgi:hypothetical protein
MEREPASAGVREAVSCTMARTPSNASNECWRARVPALATAAAGAAAAGAATFNVARPAAAGPDTAPTAAPVAAPAVCAPAHLTPADGVVVARSRRRTPAPSPEDALLPARRRAGLYADPGSSRAAAEPTPGPTDAAAAAHRGRENLPESGFRVGPLGARRGCVLAAPSDPNTSFCRRATCTQAQSAQHTSLLHMRSTFNTHVRDLTLVQAQSCIPCEGCAGGSRRTVVCSSSQRANTPALAP